MVVASTGFFDGVHRGHRSVLETTRDIAIKEGCQSAVITFWPHPRAVLQQDAAKFRLLTSLEEKRKLILSMGIDQVHVLTFDKEFAKQSTEEFFSNHLKEKYGVTILVAGYDHRVGSDLNQTQEQMFDIARKIGINPVRVSEFGNIAPEGETIISSTKIRECLINGNVDAANGMLGYRYGLEGVVVEGQRLGRTLGFPTANIRLYEPLKLLPADGVYAVWAESLGKTYKGITNIGTRPTVSQLNEKTIETHIIDFEEDIYGLSFKIEFVCRLRDEQRFSSLGELTAQLVKDKQKALSLLSETGEKLR